MIEIRRARLADVPAIRRMCLEGFEDGISTLREVDREALRGQAELQLVELEQWIHSRRAMAVLVAVCASEVVGYLILELSYVEDSTGEAQSFIYNMGVEPAYRGRYVPHKLVYEAARITHERGFRYMSSKVTASNERALITAVKMGFEIERFQLTMACGPEGPAKMPGRPMHQRGQAVETMLSLRKRSRTAKSKTGDTP